MTYSDERFGYYIVGIGGQSNAEGWAEGTDPTQDYSDPRILQLANSGNNKDKVILAKDPLAHNNGERANSIGFAMSFARLFVQTIPATKKLLLLPCAVGGSSFSDNQWRPGDNLAENYKGQIIKALALPGDNRFVGTLWHQGESDTDNETEAIAYTENIKKLIEYIRQIPGAENSFFIAGEMAPTWVQDNPNRGVVQNIIRSLSSSIGFSAIASAAGLLTHDGIHFSAAAYRVLGERYFYALTNAAANVPPPPVELRTPRVAKNSIIGNTGQASTIINAPIPSSSSGGNTPPPPVLPSTPLGGIFRYNFNSGVPVDISGNNRAINIVAPAVIVNDPSGIRGKVLRPLELGRADVTFVLSSSYTKSIWVYTSGVGMNANLISSSDSPDHVFWTVGDFNKVTGGHDGQLEIVQDANQLPFNVWTHYALTYDRASNTMKLFKNGVRIQQNTNAPQFNGGGATIKVGYYAPGENTFNDKGYLDKPAVWSSALTEAQILSIYNAEKMP